MKIYIKKIIMFQEKGCFSLGVLENHIKNHKNYYKLFSKC